MTDAISAEQEKTAALSIRVPASLLDRVEAAGDKAGCKNRTQATILVLQEGLDAIDRQKMKPHRLEQVTGRIEWLTATAVAILFLGFPNISSDRVAEMRTKLLKQIERV